MIWWLWAVLGLALLFVELMTPGGFYFLFFGAGALVTALLDAAFDLPAWSEWLCFTLLSIAALAIFRKPLLNKLQPAGNMPAIDSLVGEIATANQDIAPGETGRAELRGSTWNALNVGAATITTGQRCTVTGVKDILLEIRFSPTPSHGA